MKSNLQKKVGGVYLFKYILHIFHLDEHSHLYNETDSFYYYDQRDEVDGEEGEEENEEEVDEEMLSDDDVMYDENGDIIETDDWYGDEDMFDDDQYFDQESNLMQKIADQERLENTRFFRFFLDQMSV